MNYSESFNDPQIFGACSAQYPFMYYEPVEARPSESFYVHLKDAPQEQWPSFVMAYRPKFHKSFMARRHQRANELREKFLKQRGDRLSERLSHVAQLCAENHEKKYLKWLATRDHTVQDMQTHLQRYACQQRERVRHLRAHNKQVQNRCELLRYSNYLTRIARQHEEKRKRKGIF